MQRRNLFLTTLLLVPTVYLLSLVGFPVVYNAVMSVQEGNLGDLSHFARPFVGLANYGEAIADPTFRKVALNTGVFVVLNVIGQVGLGLLAAVCFSRSFPGANYLRGLLLATWILPGLVVGAVWKWMFATQIRRVQLCADVVASDWQPGELVIGS